MELETNTIRGSGHTYSYEVFFSEEELKRHDETAFELGRLRSLVERLRPENVTLEAVQEARMTLLKGSTP